MNNTFDEFTKSMAQSVTRRAVLKRFCLGFAGMALVLWAALPMVATGADSISSTVDDAAGDAVFPFDLYGAAVPPYLDAVRGSVTYAHGVFHFEVQMNALIPANADPGFNPPVNHLGATFGVLTDRRTSGTPFKFVGQTDTYHFNFLVGALYSVQDSGIGLPLGWSGFIIDAVTFSAVPIPVKIKGDTLIFEVSAASLGNPSSLNWVIGTECDPVTIGDEKTRSVLLVDFVPDHGYASLPNP